MLLSQHRMIAEYEAGSSNQSSAILLLIADMLFSISKAALTSLLKPSPSPVRNMKLPPSLPSEKAHHQ